MTSREYLCIDLKSFYASVECVERGLDPMTAKLAVADPKRGEGTVCLAVSPALKKLGVKNRCRVYQIPKDIIYIKAPPRMKMYIRYSADIYAVYLKYIAKEDIHVYSIDEAFLDVTDYLSLYRLSSRELAVQIMQDIKETTKITAAAGIGSNLYLAKTALDLLAKHRDDHIAVLEESSYRRLLWDHKPLSDFWRIGTGIQKRLQEFGILTMKDIAHADPALLYRLFGVDAELLIDHAWGRESVKLPDIKSYQPKHRSVSSRQVLFRDYKYEECKLILKEMVDALCLEMEALKAAARSVSLTIGYSYEQEREASAGSAALSVASRSYRVLIPHVLDLYERITEKNIPIRNVSVAFQTIADTDCQQYDLFTDYKTIEKEKKMQKTVLEIKQKFWKNAVIRGMDLQQEATAVERNRQIGGHSIG